MVQTLTKSGTGCSIGDNRAYDAWGNILSGAGSGDPKGRYCANLGHKQDDESGLTYMRARYCDASTGRFVSEDVNRSGHNWFGYVANNPLNAYDFTGLDASSDWIEIGTLLLFASLLVAAGAVLRQWVVPLPRDWRLSP